MTVPTDTVPIDRLRRLAAALETGQAPARDDASWFVAGAHAYLSDAPAIRLDAALGLHPGWGEAGWWTIGPRTERDAILGEIDRQLFGQLDIPTSARSIVALARRRQERAGIQANEAVLLARLNATAKGLPGERQIKNIIRRARATTESPSQEI